MPPLNFLLSASRYIYWFRPWSKITGLVNKFVFIILHIVRSPCDFGQCDISTVLHESSVCHGRPAFLSLFGTLVIKQEPVIMESNRQHLTWRVCPTARDDSLKRKSRNRMPNGCGDFRSKCLTLMKMDVVWHICFHVMWHILSAVFNSQS